MKKLMFMVVAALLAVGCNNSVKSYVIEGYVEGLEGNVAILSMSGEELLAEQEVTDGSFEMTIESENPRFAVLAVGGEPMLPVFLDGSPISISGDMQDPLTLAALGTPANAGYREFNEAQQSVMKIVMNENVTEEEMAEAFAMMQEIMENSYEQNKNNLWGAYVLLSNRAQMMSAEEILEVVEGYPAEYAEVEEIVAIKKQAENVLKTSVGRKYINLNLPNVEGKKVSLQSAVKANKVVLLDFWASWCRPCMAELPHLLKAYEQYHDKGFEIYGVSLDDSKEAWEKCVADNAMEWINVSTIDGWATEAAKQYGVNSIPANFLIDSEGKIIAKGLRGEALLEELAKVLD